MRRRKTLVCACGPGSGAWLLEAGQWPDHASHLALCRFGLATRQHARLFLRTVLSTDCWFARERLLREGESSEPEDF